MKKVENLSILSDSELDNYIKENNKEFQRLVRLCSGKNNALYIKLVHGQHAELIRTAKEKGVRHSQRAPT